MKQFILILICFNCLGKAYGNLDSTIFIRLINNKYICTYKHKDVSLADINESNILYILLDGSLNYIPKEIFKFKFVQEISASNVKGNICLELLSSFPKLKVFSVSTYDTIDLKEMDFSIFCPNLQNLSLLSAKGITNMPDTLANNKINYIHISPILDSILFIPSKESNFISLIAPLSYIKKVMASPNFQKAYYVELLGYSPLDSIVTSFYSSSTLKELSLFISDKKYNYEILSNIKGVEEIHLIDCPCLENLIILNNNKSLKKVSCSNSSRRNAKLLNKSSSKFNFKLVVYNK